MEHKHDYLKGNQRSLKLCAIFIAVILLTTALPSFASSTGSSPLPMNQPMQQIRDFFTGTFAWTVSIISLVVSASMLAFGSDFNGTAKVFILLSVILSAVVFANNLMSTWFAGAVIP